MYAAGRGLHHSRDWCPVSADRFASSARWFVVQTEDVGDWASGVLPVGTVTFLLTDVEGSTRLWEANQDETAAAIARHYEILDAAVGAAGGVRPVEQGEGDSIVAVFATAKDALRAALDAQRQLDEKLDGLPVRMAIHTGEAQLRDVGNYVGRTIIRCARLRACGHGGQVLVSESTAALVFDDLPEGAALVDLGLARLRDLCPPQRVASQRTLSCAATSRSALARGDAEQLADAHHQLHRPQRRAGGGRVAYP